MLYIGKLIVENDIVKPFYSNRIIQKGNKTMEFSVKGIGIIKEADIKIDGLTVIAGSNNSGKTTVGRALYSVVNAVENLDQKQDIDQSAAIVERIKKILNIYRSLLTEYEFMMQDFIEEKNKFVVEILDLDHMPIDENSDYYITLLYQFCDSIKTDTFLDFLIDDMKKISPYFEAREDEFYSEWKYIKPKALLECSKALDSAKSFQKQERKDFACKIAARTLQVEFMNQVQSIGQSDNGQYSIVRLRNQKENLFEFYISDDNINIEKSKFQDGYFDSVYFIDDPYVIEDPRVYRFITPRKRTDSYVQSRIVNHREDMRRLMRKPEEDKKISETLYQEKQLEKVMQQINAIVPGMVSGGTYYTPEMKIKVGNLATGFKIFSIIKKILTENDLSDKTLLILDEPESHLHPEWINRLAEVIVLLVKECNITVLLTTHSPNFLLAVDALMRKYDIRNKCHFYQTEQEEDHRVKYIERTDSLDDVYADFAASFAKMSAIKKKYMNLEE